MKKKSSGNFGKFAQKKSNAAIKEQFRQEKRKVKKEREEYFEKKKAASRAEQANAGRKQTGTPAPVAHARAEVQNLIPLNKFIAHAGICGRREAAEMVKMGKVKVNNELVTEPGHKVSSKDEIRVNGKKIFIAKTWSISF